MLDENDILLVACIVISFEEFNKILLLFKLYISCASKLIELLIIDENIFFPKRVPLIYALLLTNNSLLIVVDDKDVVKLL